MKKIIIGAVVVIAIIIGAWGYLTLRTEEVAYSYTPYEVSIGTLSMSIDATGTVTPKNRLEIKSPIAGRIEEILVKEGEDVKKGAILAWTSSTERAALLDAVRTKGKEELDRWEDLYRPTPVIAPINGTLILKGMETGQSFSSTDVLFTMADYLIVKANVDETDIAQVANKQKAIILLDAYPQNEIRGKVTHVAFDSTTTNNVTSYLVDVLPDEVPSFMRSGMTANITIIVQSTESVITVPQSAIVDDEGSSAVLIKSKDSYIPKRVTLGNSNGREIEVREGLSSGDVIYIRSLALQGKQQGSNPFMPSGPRGRKR